MFYIKKNNLVWETNSPGQVIRNEDAWIGGITCSYEKSIPIGQSVYLVVQPGSNGNFGFYRTATGNFIELQLYPYDARPVTDVDRDGLIFLGKSTGWAAKCVTDGKRYIQFVASSNVEAKYWGSWSSWKGYSIWVEDTRLKITGSTGTSTTTDNKDTSGGGNIPDQSELPSPQQEQKDNTIYWVAAATAAVALLKGMKKKKKKRR